MIDHIANGFPKQTWNLSDSAYEKQHFGPIHNEVVGFSKLIQIVLHHSKPGNHYKRHNIPMILLFSHFSPVVDQVQLEIQIQIIVIVLR